MDLTMLVLVLFLVDLTLTQDYCSITPQHTLCSIDQSPGSHCNGDHLARGVTPQEIQKILEVHNRSYGREGGVWGDAMD